MDALSPLLSRLEALGFDGEATNVRCLVDSPGENAAELGRILLELESLAPSRGHVPADLSAARAKVLIGLSRPEEALALLEASSGGPCRYPVRSWLGQALILTGRFDAADAVLESAVCEEPEYPWVHFFRAAAKLALSDAAGAERGAAAFLKEGESAAAFALAGLAANASGGRETALRLMKRAASAAPDEAWPLVLEAFLHRAGSDPAAAKESLRAAVERKPSAWLHAELAKTYEQLGILPEAIESAARAVRLCPCVEHHALKAHLHGCWRENAEAIAEHDRAVALRPGDAGLLFSRSKACSAAGRLPAALKDAGEAARLAPDAADFALWEVQLLAQMRRHAEAARGVSRLLRRAGRDAGRRAGALFSRGYDALCRGDLAAARRDLDACRRSAPAGALRRKAGFYRVLAALPASRAAADRAGPELALIGLGVDPPYTATADAVRAIGRCDVVFNNVMGDEMFEFLRPFCGDCRPVAYHQNNDEGRLAAEILAEARPGRRVAFVTRGSAIVQGPLGALLLDLCRERGISWDCLPAVSSAELLSARFGDPELPGAGLTVLDSRGVEGGALGDPLLPLTLFLNMDEPERQYPELCRRLSRHYGRRHPCLVLDHVIGQAPKRSTMAELPGLRTGLSPSAILFIPGKGR